MPGADCHRADEGCVSTRSFPHLRSVRRIDLPQMRI
jgi:hypothetical protein